MNLLRENKESLTSVLDAFIHDPLVEWEDERKKKDRHQRGGDTNRAKESLKNIAKGALLPIARKLDGFYDMAMAKHEQVVTKRLATSDLVESLIQEATNPSNLGRMYPGWAPWM